MSRVLLADWLRHLYRDGDHCIDCETRLTGSYVRYWHITIRRPWTWIVPEVERRCIDCGIDHDVQQHVEETDR